MAVDGGVAELDDEPAAPRDLGREIVPDAAADLKNRAASAAQQMHMVGMVREVIARDPVIDVGVVDQARLL